MERTAKLAVYENLVAGFDDLALKGKTTAYTAINGNMFSFLAPDGTWAFRLSPEAKANYEAKLGPSEVIQHNSVMRGYVEVRDAIGSDPVALKALFGQSVGFAKTLKPKPTKKS